MTCCSSSYGQVTEYLNSEKKSVEARRCIRMEDDVVPLGRAWGGAGSCTVQGDQIVTVEGTPSLRHRWG